MIVSLIQITQGHLVIVYLNIQQVDALRVVETLGDALVGSLGVVEVLETQILILDRDQVPKFLV